MKSKRERLEVIRDILKSISDSPRNVKPTHIMYKANLSSKMLSEYLSELMQGEFIEELEKDSRKEYRLTQKGFDYLNRYTVIQDFLDVFGLN